MNLLKRIWCGTLKSQLIGRGQGCTHVSEREENFYTISLDIKGKRDIREVFFFLISWNLMLYY